MSEVSSGYHGADPTVLEREGIHLAQKAVQFDSKENFAMAAFHYSVSWKQFLYYK